MKNKLNLIELLEMKTEDLMQLLPNNICDGKGDSLGTIYSPKISKNIEGKWFIEYSQLQNKTVYNERKILFEITYAKSIKIALAESLVRIEEITKALLNRD